MKTFLIQMSFGHMKYFELDLNELHRNDFLARAHVGIGMAFVVICCGLEGRTRPMIVAHVHLSMGESAASRHWVWSFDLSPKGFG